MTSGPWDTDDDKGGVTYTQYVAPEGPRGAALPPGTIDNVGSNGSFSIGYTPPKERAGTVSQAGRYRTSVDTTGAITGIPGATYQEDTLDGSITIVSKPSQAAVYTDPRDKNNDQLDDQTGFALGVYRDNNSPTGFSYGEGIAVYPNGARYTGTPEEDNPDIQMIGGVPYIWQGGQLVVAPGYTASGQGAASTGVRTVGGAGSAATGAAQVAATAMNN